MPLQCELQELGFSLSGLLVAIAPSSAQTQRDDTDILDRQVVQLYRAGQHPKARDGQTVRGAIGK
jgi:hypothetical protein